jgi:segregation and condensation protein B
MSLKAKLEAVIYAAEEPVTLAQLAMLFGNEALEWKAAEDAARAAEAEQNAEAAAEPPVNAAFDYVDTSEGTGAEPDEELLDVETQGPETQPAGATDAVPTIAEDGPAAEREAEPDAEPEAEPEANAADTEGEARRAARQRDREVRTILRQMLDEIIASYALESRGIEIREIAGGFRMATKAEFHDAVRAFVKSQKPPLKLSLPALETLAVIAYKQPITAPEVNEIRGVDSSGVFGSLLARKLIATAGRKQVIGRPILYKTTKEFLLRFGLKDLNELPSMEEFEKMAASELEDLGPAEAAPQASRRPSDEGEERASQEGGEDATRAAAEQPDSGEMAHEMAAEAVPAGEPEQPPAESVPEPPQPDHESNPSETAPPSAE